MELFRKKNTYSFLVLLLVLAGEILSLIAIRNNYDWVTWGPRIGVVFGLIILLWLIGWCLNVRFGFRSIIVTKLLANAISPLWLSVVYLLFFAIHIGWLTNAAMSLFMPNDPFCHIGTNMLVCVIGMLILIWFFPNGKQKKDKQPIKVFVSGISEIKVPWNKNPSELNLRPLARELQFTNDDAEDCELLILMSDFNKASDDKISQSVRDVLDFIGKETISLEGLSVEQQMKLLIREVIKKEFPNKTWVDQLAITFSNSCNYDNFSDCYKALSPLVEAKDNNNHRLIFNLTPGTGIVGSLMTLLAIDGDRELYYYRQEKDNNISDSERLQPVEKSDIPLKNLLSQALETLNSE